MAMPMWAKDGLRMFFLGPWLGGCSLSMSWVRVTASWVRAAVVAVTGPPAPMFSPAAVQWTPAAVSRVPRSGSPGHWCESPQPAAISALCADALRSRPAVIVRGGRPAAERAALMSASTGVAGGAGVAGVAGPAEVLGAALGAEAGWRGDADAEADSVGRARWRLGRAVGAPCGTAAVLMPMGLGSAQAPTRAAPHAAVGWREGTGPRADGGRGEAGPRVRYRLPAISAGTMSRPPSKYLARGAERARG